MSVNKDVENMYKKDAEKRKKNQKKKKKNKLITLIIVILMIVGMLFLLNYLGFGFGFGKGEGENTEGEDKSVSIEDAAVSQEESVEPQEDSAQSQEQALVVEFVDITVAGSAYIYNGNVTELEAFIDTVGKMNENIVLRIIDDNATQNAMEDLQNALDEKERKFVVNAQGELHESEEISEVVP